MGDAGRGLRIEVLGPLRVTGAEEVALARSSHRRLLSILVLSANQTVATDTLIDRNWGDSPPATAKATVQMHVAALRKLLPAELIFTDERGYRLDVAQHTLDADEFAKHADEASRAASERDWQGVLAAATAALALWRGRPYDALADDDFAQPEVARLEELHLLLLELRAEALLDLGREGEALPELERLVVEHPLRERFWEHLMTARYRAGRHADALEAYRQAYAALAEIGLEPGAPLRELERKILLHDERLTGARHNLPDELTGFVGRDVEVAEIGRLLARHRLVTLTGVGGVGKTRLALETAATSLSAFPDGCWLVELAPLRDPERVAAELAGALGLQPGAGDAAQVAAAVARDETLILLDNCEHVVDGAASLARALVAAGPRVSVLATSRGPLHVQGEVVYDVPPMSFPKEGHYAPESIREFDAVRLFEDRAVCARPSFELDRATADAVGRICRRLDGVPLAIELAAGRVGSLSPESIADHLDDRFRILTGGPCTGPARHRTLEAALDWSYELLDARERALFARLGVFEGGFDLPGVAEVCTDDPAETASIAALLGSLVEKSLVSTYEAEATRRHRLLETVRHYALRRLDESGVADVTRMRHMRWYVRVACDASARVHGPGRWELHERLDDESANLRAAFRWALANGDGAEAAELARALAWNGFDRRRLRPCIGPLRAALEESSNLEDETETECRALLGTALFLAGDEKASYAEYERVAALADRLEPSALKVWSLTACARVHLLAVDLDPRAALPFCRRALADAEASGDPFALVYARRALGRALVWNGEADEGVEQHDAALGVALATGDAATTLETYRSFFDLLYLHPEARRSEPARLADEMLARFPPDDPRWGHRVTAEDWLRYVFCQSGEWERAEALFELLGRRHLEGWDRVGYLVTLCTLRWMQGRLDDVHADLAELQAHGVPPGWFHAYFPLLAEIAADEGRLGDVRAVATAYLAVDTVPAEQSKKVAVLTPLARAEIDAALVSTGRERDEHVRRAAAAVERSRVILETFPPPTEGSIQMETPATQHALARAELSRAVAPDPALWEEALARCDYAYFRLYARWRLAASLLAADSPDEAEVALRGAHRDASAMGAERLRRELESAAARVGASIADATAPHTA